MSNGGDWRSKSLALPLMFSTTLDGFYFAHGELINTIKVLETKLAEIAMELTAERYATQY